MLGSHDLAMAPAKVSLRRVVTTSWLEHLLETIPPINPYPDRYHYISSMTSLKTINPLLYEALLAAPTSNLIATLHQICATDKAVENAFASRYIISVDDHQPNHKRKREDADSPPASSITKKARWTTCRRCDGKFDVLDNDPGCEYHPGRCSQCLRSAVNSLPFES